jgi:hypothetical protein
MFLPCLLGSSILNQFLKLTNTQILVEQVMCETITSKQNSHSHTMSELFCGCKIRTLSVHVPKHVPGGYWTFLCVTFFWTSHGDRQFAVDDDWAIGL